MCMGGGVFGFRIQGSRSRDEGVGLTGLHLRDLLPSRGQGLREGSGVGVGEFEEVEGVAPQNQDQVPNVAQLQSIGGTTYNGLMAVILVY